MWVKTWGSTSHFDNFNISNLTHCTVEPESGYNTDKDQICLFEIINWSLSLQKVSYIGEYKLVDQSVLLTILTHQSWQLVQWWTGNSWEWPKTCNTVTKVNFDCLKLLMNDYPCGESQIISEYKLVDQPILLTILTNQSWQLA